ncbi:MAG: homocysteine S-methyltransferase family protein [Ruminococcus sp.]|nr:homocysteine S-methyltransferase family protein [Ruminococcus sp.]
MNSAAFKTFLNSKEFIILDGAMGTELTKRGMTAGAIPERENIDFPERVTAIAADYFAAGSDICYTNTFGASAHKLIGVTPEEVITAGLRLARKSAGNGNLVALDIGPLGMMTELTGGELSFEDCYADFSRQIKAAVNCDCPPDLVIIETMSDLLETKAAILAVKENSDLALMVTMTFEQNSRTFVGVPLSALALMAEGLGVDAVGINCSLGPNEYYDLTRELSKFTNLPLIAKANAGLPDPETGEYKISPDDFAEQMARLTENGVKIFGGCCGTSPEFIKALKKSLETKKYQKQPAVSISAVTSNEKTVIIDCPRIIGERINPTGKKLMKEALKRSDMGFIVKQAVEQEHAGADILDVNVSLPDIDEAAMSIKAVKAIQAVCGLPLQIDSSSADVIEAALRVYAGKPIVNSVNGEEETLCKILPIVKKYGAAVVGLTLDSKGIPKSAEERFAVAERILSRAIEYGIKREDVYIDCLTLTASAEQENAYETINAVKMVKERLGLKTVLGVSNISFGLPNRELINAHFLTLALGAGLDLPIINPNIAAMTDSVRAYKLLKNIDKNAADFVSHYSGVTPVTPVMSISGEISLGDAILNGLKAEAAAATDKLLLTTPPLEIVDNIIIPALDKVGADYESGKVFLPQLIMAAGVVTESFSRINLSLNSENTDSSKGTVVLATVKGDIHDIGKNIVKVLLENYGFYVIDLGKDVPPERVVEAAIKSGAKLVGLSALMTTTLVSMEQTIKMLRDNNVDCKIMVGGAVLTAEYAEKIGADFYGKDAKKSADIARLVYEHRGQHRSQRSEDRGQSD